MFLSQTKIPLKFSFTCFISLKTITGIFLTKLSKITFGAPSVYEGKIKILWASYNSIIFILSVISFKNLIFSSFVPTKFESPAIVSYVLI